MTDIRKTLKQRGSRYGTFEENARITQGLLKVLSTSENYNHLEDMHRECLHMICHKMSRISLTVVSCIIFIDMYRNKDISDNGTYEIINASFIADRDSIFGKLNEDYAKAELQWYKGCSLNIKHIPGKIPEIWKQIASHKGEINSNYGWCIFSQDNGSQFQEALTCLMKDESSRQASMIYTRPTMHKDAFRDGMKDFICTFGTQVFIRTDILHYVVYMRSNDAVFGYKNDRYWHNFVHDVMLRELQQVYPNLKKGYLYWNAASLHVYERHFGLIEEASRGY